MAVWNTRGWATTLADMGEACMYCSLQRVIVRTGDWVGHTQVGNHVGGPGDGHRTA